MKITKYMKKLTEKCENHSSDTNLQKLFASDEKKN